MNFEPRGALRCRGVVAAVVLTTVLTACGVGGDSADGNGFVDQSAAEIQEQVVADMAKLRSVRLSGELIQSGQEIGIDLALNTEGVCAGSLILMGGSAEIIAGPDGQFIKGDREFWSGMAGGEAAAVQVTALLGEKWAKMPEAEGGLAEFCDLDGLLDEFDSVGSSQGEATIGKQQLIGGVPALELISDDEDATTAWVAVDAPHYIVRVTADGDDAGSIVFTDFDKPVDAQAPGADDVVDLSKFPQPQSG
jgi:hypothetical protein